MSLGTTGADRCSSRSVSFQVSFRIYGQLVQLITCTAQPFRLSRTVMLSVAMQQRHLRCCTLIYALLPNCRISTGTGTRRPVPYCPVGWPLWLPDPGGRSCLLPLCAFCLNKSSPLTRDFVETLDYLITSCIIRPLPIMLLSVTERPEERITVNQTLDQDRAPYDDECGRYHEVITRMNRRDGIDRRATVRGTDRREA